MNEGLIIIIVAVIVAIALFVFVLCHARISFICHLLLNIPLLILTIVSLVNNDFSKFKSVGWLGIIAIMLFFGPSCLEDSRETNVYLILGTLVENTTGNSPVKTFLIMLAASFILVGIPYSMIVYDSKTTIGAYIYIFGGGFISLNALINLIRSFNS